MSWIDTIFGYWGLPLMIVIFSGLIFNIAVGLTCFSIWAIMWMYSFMKFGAEDRK